MGGTKSKLRRVLSDEPTRQEPLQEVALKLLERWYVNQETCQYAWDNMRWEAASCSEYLAKRAGDPRNWSPNGGCLFCQTKALLESLDRLPTLR